MKIETNHQNIEVGPQNLLEKETKEQKEILADYYAKRLNFKTRLEYIETLPNLYLLPSEYEGKLEIPLIVDPRMPLKRLAKILGITIESDSCVDPSQEWQAESLRTPKGPYSTWISSRELLSGKLTYEVHHLLTDEKNNKNNGKNNMYIFRGATPYDALALYLMYPKLFENEGDGVSCPGWEKNLFSPQLVRINGKMILRSRYVGDAYSRNFSKEDSGVKIAPIVTSRMLKTNS